MLDEKNIEELKSRLVLLGFPGEMERGLRAHACLGQKGFTLHYRSLKEGGVMNVSLHFQREAESLHYHCLYYDACLRKGLEVPSAVYGEVDTRELEARMEQVAWEDALPVRYTDEKVSTGSPPAWEKEKGIEGILTDLNKLGETPQGAAIAHLLKLKFWSDTPLEGFIQNLGAQKNNREVGQRFYFFEGEEGITLEEAYRFLCHRWREKQWNAQRRGAVPANATSPAAEKDKRAGSKSGPRKRSGKGSKPQL